MEYIDVSGMCITFNGIETGSYHKEYIEYKIGFTLPREDRAPLSP